MGKEPVSAGEGRAGEMGKRACLGRKGERVRWEKTLSLQPQRWWR